MQVIVTIMLDVCYKSSAIFHVDIAQTSDSFEEDWLL